MTTRSVGLADLPLRPELVGEEPYGAPQLAVPVQLNVNENPYPPSDRVRAEMAEATAAAAGMMNRYPDREAHDLRTRLARYLGHDLTTDHIWAANGSNEVMTHILQAFAGPGRSLLTFGPTYSMYPEYARNTHTRFVVEPRAGDFTLDPDLAAAAVRRHEPDVVVLTTPNNPTGTITGLDTIRALLEVAPGMVVVDEAYQEFVTPGQPSALVLLPEHPRLVVTRTMSKAFAFAGGRVGYLAAAPAVVDACRIVRLPYHLSAITQAVASVALDNAPEMMAHVAQLRQARDDLVGWLVEQGLPVVPTQANFVLFGAFSDRRAVWQQLLDNGVLIRETGPAGMLRVSAGTPPEMTAFKESLRRILDREETN
ncbi:MAG: histidinol-phosphate transaminase [Propionibacteriaceae bacterium]|nr:histidinol-phosphate transaminase [Propionibacteriaceae bacterium]